MNDTFMIVGLGNPDKIYEYTFHNMGFRVANNFAKKIDENFIEKTKFNAKIIETTLYGNKVLVVEPLTYMNNSGDAVAKIKNFYKIPSDNILVAYDDIDLPFATLRLRQKGSAGTHNGMRSIVEKIGTCDFARLRVGIGRNDKFSNLADFVLSKVPKEQENELQDAINKSATIIDMYIKNNGDVAQTLNWMNKEQ